MENVLEVQLLSENAIMPERANSTDSGLDMYTSEEITIPANGTKIVPTDIAINLPYGFEAQVRPRSGVSVETKLRVAFGTIDQTYNKPIGIIVDNISDESITIYAGKRLAQLVIVPISYMQAKKVSDFSSNTNRGGFGSTGY